MSDIPRARNMLKLAINADLDLYQTRRAIRRALALMTRRRAEFRVYDDAEPMTAAAKGRARHMRAKGWSIRRIAEKLDTNVGRVSEAVRRDA